MNLKKFAKSICLILALVFMMASTALAVNTTDFVDFPDDWSTPAMKYAVDNGLIKGYEDNTIRANQNITRAEMAAIVNRAFGSFVEATKFPYLDVEDIDWFYSDMKKAVNMGTMQGSDNLLRPDDAITREEAFVVIARAYSQKDSDFSVLDQYPDKGDINEWSKDYLSFLTRNDYVNGFDDGNLYPQANLTRAELSQLIFNMIAEYVNSQSALDSKDTYDGNIVINGGIAEIKGKTFNGDLVIGDGVGVNKIIIEDTKIAGALIVRGTTQIKITNTTVGNRIIVNNPNNNVHFDNYRSEKVFTNVETQTSATWKQGTSGGGHHGGGGTTYYTVYFDKNYTGGGNYATDSVPSGSPVTKPVDPTRPGYTFGGWYKETACTTAYDFSTPVTGNITLYAKWTANTYTITFDGHNYEIDVEHGEIYDNFPDHGTKEGYTFGGWFTDEGKEIKEGETVDITDHEILYPKWIPNTYTLTFEGLDGVTREATYDDVYPELPVPKDEDIPYGQKFAYWVIEGTDIQITKGNPVKITEDKHLVPVFSDKDTYVVTFDANGGIGTSTQNVIEGEKATAPTTEPTREGHTFKGWYKDSAGTQVFDFNTTITEPITVYAKWGINSYAVKFVADDVIVGTFTKNYGETIAVSDFPSVPAKTGYTGVWSVTSDITVTRNLDVTAKYTANTYTLTFKDLDGVTKEATYDGVYPELPVPKDEDIPYGQKFAYWVIEGTDIQITKGNPVKITEDKKLAPVFSDKDTYVVTFDANGGIGTSTQNVIEGEKATAPTTEPTREGHTFKGWYKDVAGTQAFDFNTEITEPIIVYAKWQINQYTYTFFDEDGTTVLKEATEDYGTTIEKPENPTKAATAQYTYTFSKWEGYTDGMKVTGDVTFKAVYTETVNKYKVTFKNYDGTELESKEVEYGTAATYSGNTPTRAADAQYTYTFSGWDKDITNITGELEVTAQYSTTLNKYTYKFVDEDGTTVLKEATEDYGTTIEKPENPTKAATAQYTYTFSKWEGYTDGMTLTGDVTFKAVYTETVNKYKVVWENEDGTVLETDEEVEYGTVPTYDGATPTKASTAEFTYTFKEWTPAVVAVTGEVTYTATYTETKNKYTVTFVFEGNEVGKITKEYGEKVEVSEFPTIENKVGYTGEWDVKTDITVIGDVTVTGKYKGNPYKVYYDKNDPEATGTMEPSEHVYGTASDLAPLGFQKAGHTFKGWSKTPGGQFAVGDKGTIVELTTEEEITLYAIWETNSYNIIYHNEKRQKNTSTQYYNRVVTLRTANSMYFEKTGYKFRGWDTEPHGEDLKGENVVYTDGYTADNFVNLYPDVINNSGGEVHLYAVWEPITYKVSFVDEWNPTLNPAYEQIFTYDVEANLLENQHTRTGWVVTKWIGTDGTEYDPEQLVENLTSTDGEVIELKANWMPITYTVVYEGNGADATSTPVPESEHKYDEPKNLNDNTYTKEGYTFLGWRMKVVENPTTFSMRRLLRASIGDTFADEQEVTNLTDIQGARVILEAIWVANKYFVEYDKNNADATGTMSNSEHYYDEEAELTPNNFELEGFSFDGWRSEDGLKKYADKEIISNLTATNNAVVKLYATWKENSYTVKFDGNGATSGTMSDMSLKYTEEKALDTNEFERTGYKFLGWSTSSGAKTPEYTDKETVSKLTAEPNDVVTLYAVWEAEVYKLTFNVNGGKELTLTEELENAGYYKDNGKITVVVTYDAKYPVLPTPEYVDETMYFVSWTLDGKPIVEGNTVKITENSILVAEWTDELVHNVVFNKYNEDGTALNTTVINKTAITEPQDPTKTGYTFDFWSLDEKDGTAYDFSTIIEYTEKQTINLYPYFTPNIYKVVFDGNGAEIGIMNPAFYTYDVEKALDKNVYTRKGYTFLGWSEDEKATVVTYEDEQSVKNLATEGTVTLYAVWQAHTYEVVYSKNSDYATGVTASSQHTYGVSKPLTKNDYTRTGYTFIGWSLDTDFTTVEYGDEAPVINLTEEDNGQIIMHAVWKANTYTLTFDGLTDEIEVTYDEKYPTLPEAPEETGKTFVGWFDGETEIKAGNKVQITKDTELVPVFTDKLVHNVIYKGYYTGEDGTTSDMTATVVNGETITKPQNPTKTGYTFGYWSLNENGSEYLFNENIESDEEKLTITLYPIWTANQYKVVYDANGGFGETQETNHTYDVDGYLAFNEFNKTGNTFLGWSTDKNAETEEYKEGQLLEENLASEDGAVVTLFAIWKPNTYYVQYEANTGTGEMQKSIHKYGVDSKLTKNDFEKAGYTFKGWAKSETETTAEFADEAAVSTLTAIDGATVTLYAVWGANTYTVVYNGNDNTSGSTASSTHKYDEAKKLTKNGFEKTGYNFMGWDTDPSGETVVYEDEKEVFNLTTVPNDTINLYAVWEPIRYKVIFNDDFAEEPNAPYEQEFVYDEVQSLIPNRHEQTGYHVVGWEDENGNTYLDKAEITEPLTAVDGAEINFYTIWQNNNYYVAYDGNGATSGSMDNSEHFYDIKSNLSKNTYKKEGYDEFIGWNLVPEQSTFSGRNSRLLMAEPTITATFKDENEILNLTEILGDTVEIIAVWQPNKYYVQYNKGDEKATGTMSNSEHYYDEEAELTPNNFELEGFSFNGWRSEDGSKKYADKETISNLTATNNAVVNIYATWEENSYTVQFNGNGATTGEMSDMEFTYTEEKALDANEFERTGYKFLGWSTSSGAKTPEYTDKETVSKLTAEPNGVVTLYAVWEAETYELTFDVNGGKELTLTEELENAGYYKDNGKITVVVTYDAKYPVLPTPEYVDETMYFVSWTLDGKPIVEGNTVKITENSILVAEWTDELVHKVVFNKYYEDGTEYETTVINKTAITKPQDPTKTGYTFDFWSLDEENGTAYDFATKVEYTSVQTINLYPYFIANTYEVKYDGNGATDGTMANSTHTYDIEKALSANEFVKDGYTFMGWDTDPSGETVVYENSKKVKNLTDENGKVITLYAVWAENAYIVKYDGNGATDGTMTESTHYIETPKALNINAFEKEGYEFLGWSLDKEATVETYKDGEVVENLTEETEVTLYAVWKAKTLKLTFDVNGGEELVIDELGADYYVDSETGKITIDVTYDGQYPTLPVATYPDGAMSFGGWSINGNIIADGDTVKITEDTELVAVWTDKHIVVFHGYYNDGTDSLTTYVEDGSAAVKPEDPAHSKFTFGGWYTDEACTEGNEYDFTTIINKVNDEYQTIHLYPKWLVKVTFYYGPEAIESEKQAEILVAYNTAIEESSVPADRVAYGYWKDGTVSDVYIGEEYEHKIEFKWHKQVGEEFEEYDLTQPVTENIDLFNVAKSVDIYISSSFDAIDGAVISATYTSEEAIYENILDVIFEYQNLAGTVYDKIGQKQKVFDKLISLGIIDENMNILNQARFLKFSLMGEERLETFVYENVENELTVDAKESISSYLNHLIEKNDGSAEEFIKELIDSLLTGEGKEEMKGVLSDMLTEMVDLEKEEFIKYVNKYIDDAIAEGDTTSVEELIHPQIEKLLTEAIAKDFVREMTKEQLTSFVNIYVGTLTETELKAEVRDYIGDLDEPEIIAEVVEYVNNLSDAEIKSEITTYINSLTDDQLKAEITTYINEMDADELSEAIVEYIETLSGDELKAEIKTYINGLDEDGKKYEIRTYINGLTETERANEVTSYVQNMGEAEFKTEIKSYIKGLGDDDFKEELKKYLENNPDEYEDLIREAVNIPDDETIPDLDVYLNDVINHVMTTAGKREEVTENAAEYITTTKRAEYETEIINKVTANFDSYIDSIVNRAVTSDLDSYIGKAVDKIVTGANLNNYIEDTAYSLATGENKTTYTQKAIDTIVSDTNLKETYTTKTIDNIVGGTKKAAYVTKAVKRILGGSDRDTYINNTIDKIFTDGEEQTYIDKAVAKIVNKTPADYTEIDGHIEKMFETPEKKTKVVNYINGQFIENHDFRVAILPGAVDMIFADADSKAEVVSTIVDFVINDEDALAEVTDIAVEDLIEDAEFREHTIDRIADYLEHHPEIMEEVVEFAKETELGVFVDEFINELINYNQFKVHPDNLFVAEAIERALAHYDYDSFMDEYIPERFAGLIPDSILKPIYDNALNGFSTQLHSAIEQARLGNTAYVDSGVTVKFNPMADIIVPVFDKYLELKDKAEDKLEGNDGKPGDIYDKVYDENKYVKALVDLIKIENFLNGDSSLATETLSGYSLREFNDYYEILRNASALLSDAGKWYVDNLPKDKAEAAQEKLAQKVAEYFNSILALVNTYAETEELPSYKDVLEIFEGDIPDRFFDKYESALSKVEAKIDIDDKIEVVYNKLAERGIVSKFNTVLDKFIASKFNREITEEQVPLVYTVIRRTLGYDDFYTVDTVFDLMSQYLSRFKVTEDLYEAGNGKLKITVERSYK